MKKTKNIFAALLAVMMVLMMVPFTASAATVPEGPYTAKYKCAPNASTDPGKVGDYTFDFYKVADLNPTTGQYTVIAGVDDTVLTNAINAGNTANAISACDRLYDANANVFGNAETSISFTADDTVKTASVEDAGIYYIRCVSMPKNVTEITNNSLVALPLYNDELVQWETTYDATTIDLATKFEAGTNVKPIKEVDMIYVGNGYSPKYLITADASGSATNPLQSYKIYDIMDAGLELNKTAEFVVALAERDANGDIISSSVLTKGTDYTVAYNQNVTVNGETKTAAFVVEFTGNILKSENFYTKKIEISYFANVTADAKPGVLKNTPVEQENGDEPVPGTPVDVYTYGLKIKKVDGNDNSIGLEGAEFKVYTDAACTTPLKVNDALVKAETLADGTAVFKLDGSEKAFCFKADEKYYVKETIAPSGYNLSDEIYPISFEQADAEYYATVNGGLVLNYAVVLPQTGGMGTLVFTIGGAALIACAGVLLFVLKRKSSAK